MIKSELKPELKIGEKSLKINVDIPKRSETNPEILLSDETTNIIVPLILGLDTPNRNSLKHIEDLNPELHLITWYESANSIRYACIVKIDSGIGIWSNYCADRIVLK